MTRRRVLIIGLGVLAPNGNDPATYWDAPVNGRPGVGTISRFDASRHRVDIAGQVKDFDPGMVLDRKEVRHSDPFVHYAVHAASQAFDNAGLDMDRIDADLVGVTFGSGIGSTRCCSTGDPPG